MTNGPPERKRTFLGVQWSFLQIGFIAMVIGLGVVMLAEGEGAGVSSVVEAQAQKRKGVAIFAGGALLALGSAVTRYLKDRPKR